LIILSIGDIRRKQGRAIATLFAPECGVRPLE
jgi:hypothetical protein